MSAVLAIVLVLAVLLLLVGLAGIGVYNGFVRARVRTDEAWSAIDVQLKRRSDLVPNLVETVRGFATHEQDTLTEVIRARGALTGAHGPAETAKADGLLTQALGRLMAVSEAYPQLKASENFLALQKDLYDVEEKVAYARQFYNANVRDFNTRISVFPQSVLANLMRLTPREFFETDEAARASVAVRFGRQ